MSVKGRRMGNTGGKYEGIVLYSDLDGTLLDEQRRLHPENQEAVRRFVAEGGRFAIATGRMERTIGINFPDLPVSLPCIFYNGALVRDVHAGRNLHARMLASGLERELQSILDRHPEAGVEILSGGEAYIVRWNDIIRVQLAREGMTGRDAAWSDIPGDWYKALVIADEPVLKLAKAELESFGRSDLEILFSESTLLDMMAADVSKGSALEWIRRHCGQDWKRLYAVGDAENDADLVRRADVGIAVGNACDAVKKAAAHVIEPHSVPCIPQVLGIIDASL